MAPLIALLRLEPNGHMGAQVTPVGCLAAPTHYSSEHNLCTIMMHHHSTAKALFAGFYIITPHRHFTILQRANAGEATALTRLPSVCVATSSAQAGS